MHDDEPGGPGEVVRALGNFARTVHLDDARASRQHLADRDDPRVAQITDKPEGAIGRVDQRSRPPCLRTVVLGERHMIAIEMEV